MKGFWDRVSNKNPWKKLTILFFVTGATFFSGISPSFANTAAISWLQLNSNQDGTYSLSTDIALPFQSTSEAVNAISLTSTATNLNTSVRFLNNDTYLCSEYLSRKMMANITVGNDVTSLIAELVKLQNSDGGFGELAGYDSAAIDTAFALFALNKAGYSNSTVIESAVSYLLAQQQMDGGFPLKLPNESAVYNTALVSMALQNYLLAYSIGNEIEQASQFIFSKKITGAGWETHWETAVALLAVIPVTSDAAKYTDAVTTLRENQLSNGSWDGDTYTTALAVQADYLADNIELPANPTHGIFAGQINDASTGLPLVGVSISLVEDSSVTTTSQTDGRFTLSGVTPGQYTINYLRAGYVGVAQSASVQAGQLVNLGQINLSPVSTTGILAGVITDASTGAPVQGATVSITGASNISTTTNSIGAYNLVSIPGAVTLIVSATDYDPVSANSSIVAGGVLYFSPALYATDTAPVNPSVTVKGIIVDVANEQFLSNAIVTINNTYTATADTSGVFFIGGISAGELAIDVALSGYQTVRYSSVAPQGSTIDIGTVRLSKVAVAGSTTVIGEVTDVDTDKVIAGASVSVEGVNSGTVTASDGGYTIKGIDSLSFTMTANAVGYVATSGAVELHNHGTATVNLTLKRAAVSNLDIITVTPHHLAYAALNEAELDVVLENTGAVDKIVQLYVKVLNSSNQFIEQFPAVTVPLGGDTSTAHLTVAANSELTTEVEWQASRHPAGIYTIIIQAYGTIDNHLLAERSAQIEVLATQAIGGSAQFDPPIAQLAANKPVQVIASISNRGNLPIDATTVTAKVSLNNEGYKKRTDLLEFETLVQNQGLDQPYGMEFDTAGNMYLANFSSNTVSKIQPDGTVTEFANALNRPVDIDIDAQGNVYVLNQHYNFVKFSADDGARSEISTGLSSQQAIEVLSDGRVLIVQSKSLYEVTTDGTVNLLVSGGLANPRGMVIDSQGNIFIANRSENSIVKYVNGSLSTFVKSIHQPYGITIDDQDNLYVTSYGDNSLIKIASDGTRTTIANGLSGPFDVKISADGNFVVSNYNTSEIVSITPQGDISTLTAPSIYSPNAAVYDAAGNLYIANASRANIIKMSPALEPTVLASNIYARDIKLTADGGLDVLESSKLKHVALNGTTTTIATGLNGAYAFIKVADGNGYLVSESSNRIRRIDANGQVSSYMEKQINKPHAMRTLANGDKYILNSNSIIKVDNNGGFTTIATGLHYPRGVTVDTDGNLYVSEYNRRQILKIDTTGNVSIFAATSFYPGALTITPQGKLLVAQWSNRNVYLVGPGTESLHTALDYPIYYDLYADQSGNLWATHIWSNRVTKLASDNSKTVYTISYYPGGLAEDGQGGMYVSTYGKIVQIDSAGTVSDVITGGVSASQHLRGVSVDSMGRYWILSDSGILYRYLADKTLDVRYSSLSSPKGMVYANDGSLIVINGNSTILKIKAQNQLPEIFVDENYEHIILESAQTALITNSATVKRLNLETGVISDIASGYSNIEALAVKPGNGFAVADYNRNELTFYDAADIQTDRFVGLVNPTGILFNADGELLVANKFPGNISKVRSDGQLTPYSSVSSVRYMTPGDNGNILATRKGTIVELNSGGILNSLPATDAYGVVKNRNGDLLFLSSNQGVLYQYAADGTYFKLASGLANAQDVEVDSQNTIYLSDFSKGVVNRLNDDNSLSLFIADAPSASEIAFSSDDTLSVNYSSTKVMSVKMDGTRTEMPLTGIIPADIGGLAFDANNTLFASITRTNTVFKLSTSAPAPAIAPGDVVFTATAELQTIGLDGTATQINFGSWTPTDSGDYKVEVSVSDGQTEGQLVNNLHVGPTAEGAISLAQSTVFPDDQNVVAYLNIFGADSTSVTSIDAEGTTLTASSGAYGRAIGADSHGNIYAAGGNRIVKITPDGTVSDFVTGITVGNGLAVDSSDNIYAVSYSKVLKIDPQAQVTTLATLTLRVNAVAVDYNDVVYAVDSSNKLSRINSDGSVDVLTAVGLDYPRGLTIDAYGNFYVLNTGSKIVRISPDGKSSIPYYDKAIFEYEGVNVTADCSNNLLFAPTYIPQFKPRAGEEDIIVQLIGDTGETRQVLYGPSIDSAMSDMDVLFYDRLGKRLLVWTDLGGGKIFSFPVICGGIDVDAHLVTRADVDLSSTDPAPTNIIDNGDGTKEYVWVLSKVDNRGSKIQLNMLFKDLAEGEKRDALKQAFLVFNNSFDPANPIKVPMDIPSLLATSAVAMTPSLDASQYGADSPVNITVDVENQTDVVFNGKLELSIVDEAGNTVADLTRIAINGLDGLAVASFSTSWNTASSYSGRYKLATRLLNATGNLVASAEITFDIAATTGQTAVITGTVYTDKPLYNGWDTVQISSRVRNTTSNAIQLPSLATVTVTAADNTVLLTAINKVSELYPGSYRDTENNLIMVEAHTGAYTVTLSVKDAATGALLHSSQTIFQVEQFVSQALKGQVTVTPDRVDDGAVVICTDTVTNISSADITNVTLVQRLASLITGQIISEDRTIENLLAGSDISKQRIIGTTGFEPGGYACLLSAEVNHVENQLSAAGFEVVVPPIKIDTAFTQQGSGRLLVLLDANKHHAKEGDDEHDKGDEDRNDLAPHGPEVAPALTAQRVFLEALLMAGGWSYTIVTDDDEFTREMRSNGYVAYALFNEHEKLDKQVQQELRERIYRGEGLLVAGNSDERNKYLNAALGIKHKGKRSDSSGILFKDSVLGLNGQQELSYKDKALRVELDGAEIVAEYIISNKHDDDENQKYSKAAVTTCQFGLGRSVYAAFDLLAHATATQNDNLLDDLLRTSLLHTHPANIARVRPQVLPLLLSLTNEGIVTPGQGVITLPEGVQVLASAGANNSLNTEGNIVIPFELEEDEVLNTTFWVRLPITSSSFTFSASVQTGTSPTLNEHVVINLGLSHSAYTDLNEALSVLAGMSVEDKYIQKALKYLRKAEIYSQQNKIKETVRHLIKASDALAKSTHDQLQPVRLIIDHNIAYYAAMLPLSNESDHDDDYENGDNSEQDKEND